MKILLLNPEDRGFPPEYLLARIKGRSTRFIRDWKNMVFSSAAGGTGTFPDVPSQTALKGVDREFRWVFFQMNEGLRKIFRPFFFYAELRTIFICLRHMRDESRKAGVIDRILSISLLSEKLKSMLGRAADIHSAVSQLEGYLIPVSMLFGGLTELVADDTRRFEFETATRYLTVMAESELHPLMKGFFTKIIDSRNIMTLHKFIVLEKKDRPDFIRGGKISIKQLNDAAVPKNGGMVFSLIRQISGLRNQAPVPANLETSLYKAITVFLRQQGKDPLGLGVILEYLWKSSVQAMNMNIVSRGRDLSREDVFSELAI